MSGFAEDHEQVVLVGLLDVVAQNELVVLV